MRDGFPDRVRPGWRRERVGLVLGTSSGGMRAAEQAFAALARGEAVADAEAATYYGPIRRVAHDRGLSLDPALLVLARVRPRCSRSASPRGA